jgi:hypothetical protein
MIFLNSKWHVIIIKQYFEKVWIFPLYNGMHFGKKKKGKNCKSRYDLKQSRNKYGLLDHLSTETCCINGIAVVRMKLLSIHPKTCTHAFIVWNQWRVSVFGGHNKTTIKSWYRDSFCKTKMPSCRRVLRSAYTYEFHNNINCETSTSGAISSCLGQDRSIDRSIDRSRERERERERG